MGTPRLWRIGRLAQATGMSVRTLSRYAQLGLVAPSHRTDAGHVLYTSDDVERLYRVIALTGLGVPLTHVGAVLASGEPLDGVLAAHLDHVDRRLAALGTLRARLAATRSLSADRAELDPDVVLALVAEVTNADETERRYLTGDQVSALAERREPLRSVVPPTE